MRDGANAAAVLGVLAATGAAMASDPVERLTEPQEILLSGTESILWFSDILSDGTVFGWAYEVSDPYRSDQFRIDTSGIRTPVGDPAVPSFSIHEVSDDGRWVLGGSSYRYEPGTCSNAGVVITGRWMRLDGNAQVAEYLTPLCPNFEALRISGDGQTIAGMRYRGDSSWDRSLHDAALWREGKIEILDLPSFQDLPPSELESLAYMTSETGRVAVGGARRVDHASGSTPFGEAIRWTEGTPEVLPHAFSDDSDAQVSVATMVSADGSAVFGLTDNWNIKGETWERGDRTFWIDRDGEGRISIWDESSLNLYGMLASGELVFGGDFTWDIGEWRGVIWAQDEGLMRADAWLALLGVDLGGQAIREVEDMSADGHWMLATLRVDDEHEQYARIRIPCSPADLTADRVVSLDDLAIFVERFETGHPLADLSGDGVLGLRDIVAYVGHYLDGCDD